MRVSILAVLLCLASAAPASALDWSVDVSDFQFTPPERHIAVGDKVAWSFTDGGHTTTSNAGQPERWDSDYESGGATFEHVFQTPGRYQYFCRPHRSYMKGVIVVGEDAVSDTVDRFRTRHRGRTATISFTLNEPARVTYKLRGPKRRTVKKGRLEAGDHRIKVKRLARGTYRGTLSLSDDFDNAVTQKKRFAIG
jgi:plastocyanin